MTVQVAQVKIEEVNFDQDLFIDVRSPGEFAEFRLPNAINVPLFSNEERAQVGTVFKRNSREEAIELGLALYAPKMEYFYKRIKDLQTEMPNRRIVVYCFRGGLRSRTIAGTIGLLGVDCVQLEGGIRSFRKYIQEGLEQEAQIQREYLVLSGHTGTRKTEILNQLQNKGYPVIDLENLAGHRGSIFGYIGVQPNSQKQFDYLLLKRLKQLEQSPYVIIEGESKRLGRVILPDFLLEGKQIGERLELHYPFWARVEHVYQTYDPIKYKGEIQEGIDKITKYLSYELKEEMKVLLDREDYKGVFAKLLEGYYDPRYAHKFSSYKSQATELEFETLDEGVEKVITYIEHYKTMIKK
ncbi:tRNA 2-selenouridine(34) synthase MnmH [Halalkalibacter akibai]|uniref:Selenophosphate-dependent tRNA 2-selenouridine synthase n=1 Tax=Halalkalibacter akibai (strain ATCC 43226 / DSM 21942 / CIP 109018 / JCM 9157 / 1139) TaxID=1236973 RepID=W4QSU8_HALA3|nr:tRNA 2-selenouridine(34) synthase MnmH [Halalkalibacter akibai]GAE34713.1 selenophosphate-dependent tRNA 2-selenouridine synthase [Halalkalibacter akibai JCM 9157]